MKGASMQKFENGTIVFVNGSWNTAEKCIVTNFVENESSTHQNVYLVNSIDTGGTFGAAEDCIFDTKEAALDADSKRRQSKIDSYKSEIKTLEDLLRFPMNHCFNGDEYTDWEAMTAYQIRAKELTGVDLSTSR